MSLDVTADTPEVLAVSLSTLGCVMLIATCAACSLMVAVSHEVLDGNQLALETPSWFLAHPPFPGPLASYD